MEKFSLSPATDLQHDPSLKSDLKLKIVDYHHWIPLTYEEAEALHFHLGVILQERMEKDNAEIQD